MLDRVHRFGGGIARLAAAIRAGDADAVMELLRAVRPTTSSGLDGDVADAGRAAGPCRQRALVRGPRA